MEKHLTNLTLSEIYELFDSKVLQEVLEWPGVNIEKMYKSDWVKLLICVNGIELLRKPKTREVLSTTLSDNEYEQMRKVFNAPTLTINQIVKKIKGLPWKPSKEISSFLSIFGFGEEEVNGYDILPSSFTLQNKERFYELFDYQFIIKQQVINELKKEEKLKRLIIQMPTGSGKTKTAMHILSDYFINEMHKKGIVLWLAHTHVLIEQAVETLTKTWNSVGDGEIAVARLYDNHELELTNDFNGIIFCGFNKLISLKKCDVEFYNEIKKRVVLIIVDEAHRAPAKQTKNAIIGLMELSPNDKSLVGLTATVGRSNTDPIENEKLLRMFEYRKIGIDIDVLNKINMTNIEILQENENKGIINYLQEREILSKLKREKLDYQRILNTKELEELKTNIRSIRKTSANQDFPAKLINILAENKSRNISIINRICELDQQEISTIVFACSLTHAKILSARLIHMGINNVLVTGEMSPIEKNHAIEEFKSLDNETRIIINYEALTTGFDATNISCVFITRPTNSIVVYSQMIGRGLRGKKMGGKSECLLIDIEDNLKQYRNETVAYEYFDNYWN